jgi:type VI protein secretion system component VasF
MFDAITARLQNGDEVESLIAQSEAPQQDLDEFLDIIQALHTSLTPLEPRQEYADSLRADLLGRGPSMLRRVRQMPARMHVAAVLAIFFGCVLFVLRRLLGSETTQDIQEEAVVTPL